jgi:hypothetical protein
MPRKPRLQPPATDAAGLKGELDHELPTLPSGRVLLLLLGAMVIGGWVIWRAIYG